MITLLRSKHHERACQPRPTSQIGGSRASNSSREADAVDTESARPAIHVFVSSGLEMGSRVCTEHALILRRSLSALVPWFSRSRAMEIPRIGAALLHYEWDCSARHALGLYTDGALNRNARDFRGLRLRDFKDVAWWSVWWDFGLSS